MANEWFDSTVPEEIKNGTLFKFKLKFGDKEIELDMMANIAIDYADMIGELSKAPSEFAYWAAIYCEVKHRVSVTEKAIRCRRARVVDDIIKKTIENNYKVTDKQLQALVDNDEKLVELEAKYLIDSKNASKLYYVVEAMKMKADNMRSLSGFAKLEMQG